MVSRSEMVPIGPTESGRFVLPEDDNGAKFWRLAARRLCAAADDDNAKAFHQDASPCEKASQIHWIYRFGFGFDAQTFGISAPLSKSQMALLDQLQSTIWAAFAPEELEDAFKAFLSKNFLLEKAKNDAQDEQQREQQQEQEKPDGLQTVTTSPPPDSTEAVEDPDARQNVPPHGGDVTDGSGRHPSASFRSLLITKSGSLSPFFWFHGNPFLEIAIAIRPGPLAQVFRASEIADFRRSPPMCLTATLLPFIAINDGLFRRQWDPGGTIFIFYFFPERATAFPRNTTMLMTSSASSSACVLPPDTSAFPFFGSDERPPSRDSRTDERPPSRDFSREKIARESSR